MLTMLVSYRLVHEGHVLKLDTLKSLGPKLCDAVAEIFSIEAEDVDVVFLQRSDFDIARSQVSIAIDTNASRLLRNPDSCVQNLGIVIRRTMLPSHVGFTLRVDLDGTATYTSKAAEHGLGDLMEQLP